MQTLKEFLEDYKGFNYENGEVVIVNQRAAKSYICRYTDGELRGSNILHDFTIEYEMPVWNWINSKNTMLITL